MALTVRDYLDRRGMTKEQLASELSALLGRKVTPNTVQLRYSKPVPKAWAAALHVDVNEPPGAAPGAAPASDGEGVGEERRTDEGASPRPPPGARQAPGPAGPGPAGPEPVDAFAAGRIAQAYALIGVGLGSALENVGVQHVVDDFSPHVARAWVEAAKENEFARRFVAFMTAGGATGELVVLHLGMVGGILYVKGVFPDVGLFAKWSGFREQPAGAAAAAGGNGAGPHAAGAPVGEPPGPSS